MQPSGTREPSDATAPGHDVDERAGERRVPSGPVLWIGYAGTVLGLLVVQRVVSDVGDAAARAVDTSSVDPGGWWAPVSVHHVVQGLLALGLLLALARWLRLDVGLRVGDARAGWRAVGVVGAALVVYLAGYHLLAALLDLAPAVAVPPDDARAGYLGFQLLLSGPSEELLFRALPVAVLAALRPVTLVTVARRWPVSLETVVGAALFAVAHVAVVGGTLVADPSQLAYAFVLGTVQGVVFQRTRSVLYPMAIHSLSNVLVTFAAVAS